MARASRCRRNSKHKGFLIKIPYFKFYLFHKFKVLKSGSVMTLTFYLLRISIFLHPPQFDDHRNFMRLQRYCNLAYCPTKLYASFKNERFRSWSVQITRCAASPDRRFLEALIAALFFLILYPIGKASPNPGRI